MAESLQNSLWYASRFQLIFVVTPEPQYFVGPLLADAKLIGKVGRNETETMFNHAKELQSLHLTILKSLHEAAASPESVPSVFLKLVSSILFATHLIHFISRYLPCRMLIWIYFRWSSVRTVPQWMLCEPPRNHATCYPFST
jgi:hypothetical protein